MQRCGQCTRLRWPGRPICNDCHSSALEWVPVSGRGAIESWTVTHHSFGPAVAVPFVVVLVRLDDQDDIYMPGYFDGPGDGLNLQAGQPVVADFEDVALSDGGSLRVVLWRTDPPA
ncbi:MAG: OB-fold domain-containing protein [Acidimicrobiales bacterium]|nr:OB-fold domain-containing protein [Acidimicrobiales bacterium]